MKTDIECSTIYEERKMTKKLPEDVKLRRRIRRTVESKKNYLDKPGRENYRQTICTFLEKFVLCEVGTKKALSSYYQKNGNPKEVEDMTMSLTDIKKALEDAGFDISSMPLDEMYKKNCNRGAKSARDLRNAIVHDLSAEDINELIDRWSDIEAVLDSYLGQLQKEPLE